MKTTLFCTIFLFMVIICKAQEMEGRYYDHLDYMVFENGLADFRIQNDGGLTIDLYGKGKFEIIDDFLLIHTAEYQGEKSSYTKNEKMGQYSTIIVRDEKGVPLPFINIAFLDSTNKVIGRGVADTAGKFSIINSHGISRLKLQFAGYSGLTMDFKPNFDYQVRFVGGLVIENKIVVFKMNNKENGKIKLVLLMINYIDSGCNSKTLKKMYKKVKKHVGSERIFIKEQQ